MMALAREADQENDNAIFRDWAWSLVSYWNRLLALRFEFPMKWSTCSNFAFSITWDNPHPHTLSSP
jgi:hypothetical protein